ncbi:MAG: alpha/beta hydrolase [Luteolibacter sp.]
MQTEGVHRQRKAVWKGQLIRLGVWLVMLLGILFSVLVWYCVSEISEPPRRPIQAYAQPYLDGTAKSGFTVESFTSSGGMPCLVCVPTSTDVLSERAGIIRNQLTEKGVGLEPVGTTVGNLLILHGRKGMKEDYLPVAERFCAVGFVCVIPDLPGHGSNPERYTTYGVLEAPKILDCYHEAVKKFNLSMNHNAVIGQSMGGSEAVHVAASTESDFQAMVLLATFDKLETVIQGQTDELLGSILGAAVRAPADTLFGWKTGLRFSEIRPIDKVPQVKANTLVVHGEDDKMIPPSRGKALFNSLPEHTEKEWLLLPDAGHSNILITDYPLYAKMAEWLLSHISPPLHD